MTLFFADLVREFSYGTGSGPLPLGGAVPGHRAFAGVVPEGARFLYAVAGVTRPEEWETGEGEVADGLLVRTPAVSSAGGGAVDFSPGLKTVALTATAAWFSGQEEGGGPVAVGDVEGLAAALAGKAAAGHNHDGAYAAAAHGHDGVYQPHDAELSAIAGLAGQADRVAYFTGPGAAALTPLTAFGRSLVDDANAAAARTTLGLGAAAVEAIGTSGAVVGRLNGANVHSGAAKFTGGSRFSGSFAGSTGGAAIQLGFVDIAGYGALIGANDADAGVNKELRFIAAKVNFGTAASGDGFIRMAVADTSVNLGFGVVLKADGTQVVGARRTGWTTASGTATRTSFDTAGVTTAQLAERVKALIDDLAAHGLIGS